MGQHYRYVYEVKFKNGSYEFITGNSEFYRFLKDDFFITFDSLLTDSSKGVLEKAIRQHAFNTPFVLEFFFSHDREACYMVAVIADGSTEESTVLRMIELDRMYDDYNTLMTERQEDIVLLSQIESIYYSYDAATGIITCYNYREDKNVINSADLQQWEKESLESLPEQAHSNVTKFVSNLKNGTRNFIGVIPANEEGDGIDFSGTAIYN
ncbi:MAG: hypothetical protein K2K09_04415, partial [Lachnospiraceae bacterium]|nr:hypothetical protein [Lachnospiraceae bacterium]